MRTSITTRLFSIALSTLVTVATLAGIDALATADQVSTSLMAQAAAARPL